MPALTNSRHEVFCQGVAKGMTGDEAYTSAGYKPNRCNAARLKSNENIMKRIAEIAEAGAELAEIDVARTLKELVRLGTSDIRKLFDEDGNLHRVVDLDDDTAASISSVEVIVKPGVPGPDGEKTVEHVHKFKMWDKNSALEKIGKHLAMFTDKFEHTGKDGGPIQTEEVSARDRISSKLARLADVSSTPSNTGGSE